jgi:hypothetical protein
MTRDIAIALPGGGADGFFSPGLSDQGETKMEDSSSFVLYGMKTGNCIRAAAIRRRERVCWSGSLRRLRLSPATPFRSRILQLPRSSIRSRASCLGIDFPRFRVRRVTSTPVRAEQVPVSIR